MQDEIEQLFVFITNYPFTLLILIGNLLHNLVRSKPIYIRQILMNQYVYTTPVPIHNAKKIQGTNAAFQ